MPHRSGAGDRVAEIFIHVCHRLSLLALVHPGADDDSFSLPTLMIASPTTPGRAARVCVFLRVCARTTPRKGPGREMQARLLWNVLW